jgi:hypothetical protein
MVRQGFPTTIKLDVSPDPSQLLAWRRLWSLLLAPLQPTADEASPEKSHAILEVTEAASVDVDEFIGPKNTNTPEGCTTPEAS